MIFSGLRSLESAGCFKDGVSWGDDYLQGITIRVPSAQACLELCTETADCKAFTWLDRSFPSQYLTESCLTYTRISALENCKECTSGQVAACKVCSQPVECQIGANLLAEASTSTELECKETCENTPDCSYYTWFDGSTVLKNLCFLLTSCGDTVECEGCSSGPPQCPTDYCEGIEFNLLDDPTRNENNGK